MLEVGKCEDKPDGFEEACSDLLRALSSEHAKALAEAVRGHYGLDIPWNRMVVRFIRDVEWNWRDGRPPIADW